MSKHLFLVSIGPVQEFIAAARRSRDLWFGSWVLSELGKVAARTIAEAPYQGRLIFPAEDALNDQERSVPNRIMAELDATVDVGNLGTTVVERVHHHLVNKLGAKALKAIDWPTDRPWLQALALEQLADFIESICFWAATPLAPDYPTARHRLEDLMAGRKLTRTFRPSPITSVPDLASLLTPVRLPKSTLDGSRESVIDERLFAERGDGPPMRRKKALYLFQRYGARPAERLSGVDLLKRRGEAKSVASDIPSTSHFAALPLLQRVTMGLDATQIENRGLVFIQRMDELKDLGAQPELLAERYQNVSMIGGYDAGILFAERLVEEVDRADLNEARGVLTNLLTAITDGAAPEPYYALLAADGDFMGDTIDRFQTPESHRLFSQALSSFASDVRDIVEQQHQGALVYAGGDDVLAFLPLHTVLDCAQALATKFRDVMAKAIKAIRAEEAEAIRKEGNPPGSALSPKSAPPPSLSVGIAIAHHIEPLSDALDLAREAEDCAKKLPGKNALAITLSKRSGVDRTIRGSWGTDTSHFVERLQQFITLYREDALPDGAAYELRDLAVRLGNAPEKLHTTLDAAMRKDAVRIMQRKRGSHGDAAPDSSIVQRVSIALGDVSTPENGTPIDVATLADELIIAREFARALGALPSSVATPPSEGA